MYSETDIESAVQAGAITPEAAQALRDHVAALHATPAVDEERFRLITGFNDIFVTIACLLVIFAGAAAGGEAGGSIIGGALVAAASWLMAEVFTARRRMALPSIVLLLSFTIGLGCAAYGVAANLLPEHVTVRHYPGGDWPISERYPWEYAVLLVCAAVAAGLGALVHWLRFRVAITVAAAAAALAILLLGLLSAVRNQPFWSDPLIAPAALVCGLAIFAYAMRWDLSDRLRTTQRADVAFWLHLVAAPLIAHPLFRWLGVTSGEGGLATALGVLAIYLGFALIALSVDRRALLVSALAYVLIALTQLFRSYGAIELNVALTALVIGSALLALSAWWQTIRRRVVGLLLPGLARALPPVG